MSRADVTLRFHLVGIALALCVILYVVWEAEQHGRTSFRMGREKMSITVAEQEGALAWYYTVTGEKILRVARTHFRDGGGWWPPRFQLVWGADPNVAAVIEREDPLSILVLYDNSNGASWPAEPTETGEHLLARFIGSGHRGYHISIADDEKKAASD
jgi:hypothetical protein